MAVSASPKSTTCTSSAAGQKSARSRGARPTSVCRWSRQPSPTRSTGRRPPKGAHRMATAGEIARTYLERMRNGDARGAFDLFAEDVTYRVMGSTPISVEAQGRRDIIDRVIKPFTSRLEGNAIELICDEIIDGGATAAVALAHSKAVSDSGHPYENEYAIVFRVSEGKITSVVEFLDTALVETAVFNKRLVESD